MRLAFALIAVSLVAVSLVAGRAVSQPAVATARHGYALPADASPAAEALPRAYPPEPPRFYQDLDLPQVGDYQDEVLRYSETGLGPTLVVQFAAVRPGRPVQVMIERATGLSHLREATRAFGEISWLQFQRLKGLALAPILAPPSDPASDASATDGVTVTAVNQVCALEYSGEGLLARRRIPCAADGAAQAAREAMLEAAKHAAPSPSGR
jgi:hypothetical protein